MNATTAADDSPIGMPDSGPMHSPPRELTHCGDPWLAFDLLDPIGNSAMLVDHQRNTSAP